MKIEKVIEYYVIKAKAEKDKTFSKRKLEYLIFLAQVHNLVIHREPLMNVYFVAGEKGPGHWKVETYYNCIQTYYRAEHAQFMEKLERVANGEKLAKVIGISAQERQILDDVFCEFKDVQIGQIHTWLTAPGTPYDLYKNNEGDHEIPFDLLITYYSRPENRIKTMAEKQELRDIEIGRLKEIRKNQRFVKDVAKWFVKKAMLEDKPLGINKLMTMCYYAQGKALKELGHLLFTETMRTGGRGPYIAAVYNAFKNTVYDDLDPFQSPRVPSVNPCYLNNKSMPIDLEPIYRKYIDVPPKELAAAVIEEVPCMWANDSVINTFFLKIEFIDKGDRHVY